MAHEGNGTTTDVPAVSVSEPVDSIHK